MLFLCNIANFAQRTFEIVQKSRSLDYHYSLDNIIMLVDTITILFLKIEKYVYTSYYNSKYRYRVLYHFDVMHILNVITLWFLSWQF